MMRNLETGLLCAAFVATLLVRATVTSALAADSYPAPVKSEAGLLAADETRYKAMAARDVDTVNRLLGDELTYTHSMGNSQTKAEHFGDFSSGRAKYNHIDIKEAKGRVYGDVGVINGVADFWERDATKGRTLSYMDVWVWRDKRWQMVDFHCAEVRQPNGLPPGAPPVPGGPAGGPGGPGGAPPGPSAPTSGPPQ
jgi:hypothetical protein